MLFDMIPTGFENVHYTMRRDGDDQQTPRGQEFLTTHWSIVLAAGLGGSPSAAAAMEQLCCSYWFPIYAHVRRCGWAAPDAQDLTQEFFSMLVERDDLARVGREKGRFRSFLLASVGHFMANQRKKAGRLKRGGGKIIISINSASAEERYGREPSHDSTPEKLFERTWAITLLGQVMDELREEARRANKLSLFESLKVFLTGEDDGPTYAKVGSQHDMTEAAVKMAVSRLRRRYRDILRTQIARTVATADEIDEEIRHLFIALS